MKILINVVNARNVGGGLQVVYNFLLGTMKFPRKDITWFYAVSKCLDQVYLDDDFKRSALGRYFVYPNQPDFKGSYLRVQRQLRSLENEIEPDVIYTILGPSYNFFKRREVIRFVHPWVVTDNPYAWSTLTNMVKFRMKLHIKLLKALVRRTRFIVTQTDAVKKGLIEVLHKSPDSIRVINNVLPAVYSTLEKGTLPPDGDWIDIPAIGGGEHKNLDLIPEILLHLEQNYKIRNYRFNITLPNSSPVLPVIMAKAKEYGVSDRIINHGNLKQQDLAILYRKCRISFLPSVLEVFSASTIESMFFELPTVATDLFFNTEVFGDACLYYKPKDAIDAANKIVEAVTNPSVRHRLKEAMAIRLQEFSSFEKYFNDTVDYLVEVGEGKHDK